MNFTFETVYNQKALTAMAKAVRKTMRAKHSRRSHIFGSIIAVVGAAFVAKDIVNSAFEMSSFATLVAVIILVAALIFEDKMNAYFAGKRAMQGTQNVKITFNEEGYISETQAGTTHWKYDNIAQLARTGDYIAFVFSANHAQVYDTKCLTGGTVQQFLEFIEQKTGKKMQSI